MNVIFLDFDGVLNNKPAFDLWLEHKRAGLLPVDLTVTDCIDHNNVDVLNKLIAKTGAKCVASTTWRLWWTKERMQEHLERFGFIGEIIDVTPNLNGRPRGDEILAWLNRGTVDVAAFVILDDCPTKTMDQFLIKTDDAFGLQDKDVEKAIWKMEAQNA